MPAPDNFIDRAFSMDMLEGLNPKDPNDMAEIMIGTHIINTRAAEACRWQVENADRVTHDQMIAAELQGDLRAADNFAHVAKLLGSRSVSVTVIDPGTPAIKFRGDEVSLSATGVPLVENVHRFRRISPQIGRNDTLRIYSEQPNPDVPEITDWWDAQVVGADYVPLVEIKVVDTKVEPPTSPKKWPGLFRNRFKK